MKQFSKAVKAVVFLTFFVLAVFAFSAEAIDVSQNWSPATEIKANTAPYYVIGSEPWMRLLSDGRTLLTYTADSWKAEYMVLPVNGNTWNGPYYIPPIYSNTGSAYLENGGDITQLRDGQILRANAVFFRHPTTGAGTADLYTNRIYPSQLDNNIPFSYNTNWTLDQPILPQVDGSNGTKRNAPTILNVGPSAINSGKDHLLMASIYGVVGGKLPTGIYMVESNDSGETWNPQTKIYDGPIYDSKPGLLKLDNGDILCAFYSSEPYSVYSPPRLVNGTVYTIRSSDNGETWQNPVIAAKESLSTNDPRWDFFPVLLQLTTGEIWLAFTSSNPYTESASVTVTKIVRSSDRGATWGHMETIPSNPYHSKNRWPALVQRQDSSILVVWSAKSVGSSNSWDEATWQSSTLSPRVSITSPTILSIVRGTVNIQVNTTGATKVDYYLDSSTSPMYTTTTAPFNFPSWNTTSVSDGVHTIQAVAYDSTGKKGDSIISVIVNTIPDPITYTHTAGNLYWATYSDYRARLVSARYTITNNNVVTVNNITIDSSYATNGVTLNSYTLPLSLGPFQSAEVILKWYVPAGVTNFRQYVHFICDLSVGTTQSQPASFAIDIAAAGNNVSARYTALNGTTFNGVTGSTINSEYAVTGGYAQDFVNGRLIFNTSKNQTYWLPEDTILTYYDQLGGTAWALPISDEYVSGSYNRVDFSNGYSILWSSASGAFAAQSAKTVGGAISTKYYALGGAGVVGTPLFSEYPVYNASGVWVGQAQDFTNGRLYWHKVEITTDPYRGQVFWVHGAIIVKYDQLGRERGFLGLPTSDEYAISIGRASNFQGGNIYWSSVTGAFEVHGAILGKYLQLSGPSSRLRFPASDEYACFGGAYRCNNFQGGYIRWSQAGTIVIYY